MIFILSAVTSGVSSVITWLGTVVTALVDDEGALYALLPLFAIGIACSAVFLGVKAIKSLVWGA